MVLMGWTEQTNGTSVSTRVCWRRIRSKCCGTSTYIVTTRPNTVVVGEEDTVCKIIDVAVLADCRVNSKESEKWL